MQLDYVLRDNSNLNLAVGSNINIANFTDPSLVYAYIGSQISGLPLAAVDGGVNLLLNTGLAATGGTFLVTSSLE